MRATITIWAATAAALFVLFLLAVAALPATGQDAPPDDDSGGFGVSVQQDNAPVGPSAPTAEETNETTSVSPGLETTSTAPASVAEPPTAEETALAPPPSANLADTGGPPSPPVSLLGVLVAGSVAVGILIRCTDHRPTRGEERDDYFG